MAVKIDFNDSLAHGLDSGGRARVIEELSAFAAEHLGNLDHVESDPGAPPSDCVGTIEDFIADGTGAKWAAYWRVEGRHHTGEFLGWGPTKRPVIVHLLTMRHLQPDGTIKAHTEFDRLHSLHQIGVRAVGRPILPGR